MFNAGQLQVVDGLCIGMDGRDYYEEELNLHNDDWDRGWERVCLKMLY